MITEWINARFGINLNEEDLLEIKDFAFIWNVFESRICDKYFSIEKVEDAMQTIDFKADEFQPHLDYFKHRYMENNISNDKFIFLRFNRSDREDFVRAILLDEITNTKSIILGMIIIVYRFRNNLFHGNKDIRAINEQQENFTNANSLLMKFLNYFEID